MAWPFTSVGAPNLDTGPGAAVPTTATAITASAAWLLGAHFKNNAGVSRQITVTDTAGLIACELTLPPESEMPYEWPFRPMTGVKWFADGLSVIGHVWGYV